MAVSRSTLALIRSAAPYALVVLVITYFASSAMLGTNGILALGDYKRQHAERSAELTALSAERLRLERRAALLDPKRVDPDMADELVRRELGLLRPDEVILATP